MFYQYEALPTTGQKYARFLVLKPGQGNAPLAGDIVTCALDFFPRYQAISYVWGAPTGVDKLHCQNGGEVSITANLSGALRRIRHESNELTLWVDQLCIDQNDLAERGSQVSMMGEIYKKAESTLICLGGWDVGLENTNEIATLLDDVNLYVDDQLANCEGDWYQLSQAIPSDLYFDDPRWKSYRALMCSPWFHRVWCVQEAGLSKKPRLLYGAAEFEWDPIFRVSTYLRDAGFPIANKHGIPHHATHTGQAWIWGENGVDEQAGSSWHLDTRMSLSKAGIPGVPWHLLELLHSCRDMFLTDDRDYIYAFMGQQLLTKIMDTPDYTIEPAEVYRRFALGYLRETGDLNLLAYVQRGKRRPREEETDCTLRTWMPDWTRYGASVMSQFRDRGWEAGGAADGSQHFTTDTDTGVLEIQASTIDTIAFCSPVFTIYDFSVAEKQGDDSVFEEMSNAWPETLREVFGGESKCAYEDRYVPFAKAMTVGGIGDDDFGRSMAAAYLSHFFGTGNYSLGPLPEEISHGQVAHEADPAPTLWFESRASMPSTGRRFIVTTSGYYGLVPAMADVGDLCCVIRGARAAYILRPIADVDGRCELIGEAYIQGAMIGEFVADGKARWEKIVLV